MVVSLSETDLRHLRHCVELAREALDDGDEPFGSVLVSGAGEVLYADRNPVKDGDQTRHPEFDIARWAGEHLPAEWGVPPGPVTPMSVQQVAPGVLVDGPAPELEAEVRALHARLHGASA